MDLLVGLAVPQLVVRRLDAPLTSGADVRRPLIRSFSEMGWNCFLLLLLEAFFGFLGFPVPWRLRRCRGLVLGQVPGRRGSTAGLMRASLMTLGLSPDPLIVFAESARSRPQGPRSHKLQHARMAMKATAPKLPKMTAQNREVRTVLQPPPQMVLAGLRPDALAKGALESVVQKVVPVAGLEVELLPVGVDPEGRRCRLPANRAVRLSLPILTP